MVSGESQPAATVIRLPDRERVPVPIGELEAVGPRAVRTGSHVVVAHDPALRPEDGLSVSTWIWLAPDAPRGRRRALLATWGENGDGWALVLDADGRPCFEVGAGGHAIGSPASRPVEPGAWARLEAELDPAAATLSLTHRRRRGRHLETVDASQASARAAAPGPAARAAAAGRRTGAGRRRRGAPRRQARRARDRVRGRRRDPRRRVAARRGTGASRPRRRPARPARVVRERPAARGHRARLARRRARLAPGAGSVRGDALPLRRRRRPRLAAELRARAARLAAGRRVRAAARGRRRRGRGGVRGSPRAGGGPGAERPRPADVHLPGLLVRAGGPRRRPRRSAPRTAGSPRLGSARSTTATRTASASTRPRCCGRSPSCARTTAARSTVARTASPRT